jgi:hypothetical protein
VSYDYTAAKSVEMHTREFAFIRNPLDYSRTAEAVRSLLWSYGIPQEQLDRSRKRLDEVAKCTGTVRIVESRLGRHSVSAGAPAERIEWLKVEVELCKLVPAVLRDSSLESSEAEGPLVVKLGTTRTLYTTDAQVDVTFRNTGTEPIRILNEFDGVPLGAFFGFSLNVSPRS